MQLHFGNLDKSIRKYHASGRVSRKKLDPEPQVECSSADLLILVDRNNRKHGRYSRHFRQLNFIGNC